MKKGFYKKVIVAAAVIIVFSNSLLFAQAQDGDFQGEGGQPQYDGVAQQEGGESGQCPYCHRSSQCGPGKGRFSKEQSGESQQGHKEKGKRGQDFMQELGLTQEQNEQLKQNRAENMQVVKQIEEQIQAKRQQLKQEIEKETVDKAVVETIITEISVLNAQQLRQHTYSILATKELLTPEQFAKLQKKHKQKMQQKKSQGKRGFKKQGHGQGKKYHQGQEDQQEGQED